jgi:hypothetical protein
VHSGLAFLIEVSCRIRGAAEVAGYEPENHAPDEKVQPDACNLKPEAYRTEERCQKTTSL